MKNVGATAALASTCLLLAACGGSEPGNAGLNTAYEENLTSPVENMSPDQFPNNATGNVGGSVSTPTTSPEQGPETGMLDQQNR